MKEIKIRARYGDYHTLKHCKDDLYSLEDVAYYRIIYNENPDKIDAIDPDGGPYMRIGDSIEGFIIKDFVRDNDNVLIKLKSNEN